MTAPVTLLMALIYANPNRLRTLQGDKVRVLADSIALVGLQTPISVRATTRVRDGRDADAWEIVTGHHRHAAAASLKWPEIECVVFDGDERDARLWEIAENLHRAELTVLERAEHVAEWVRLTGEKVAGATCATQPDAAGRQRSQQQMPSGINAAVRQLGIKRTDAQRSIKVAKLDPTAKAAAIELGLNFA